MKQLFNFPLLYCFLIILILDLSCSQPKDSSYSHQWTTYSGDATGSKYSGIEQINPENVSQLELLWTYRSGDSRQSPATTIECNPIIIEGVMYLTTPGLKLTALDAANGEELWQFDPYQGAAASGVNRGVTYWSDGNDHRIFYVAGSNLYAIDAANGKVNESFGQNGTVNLYQGLGRDVYHTWVTAATPGIIYQDLLILGATLGEGPAGVAPGHIRAFDVRSGEQRWIFHTIPYPDELGYDTWPEDAWQRIGGANPWGGFTLDQKRGIVFCGTGSAAYDHWGGDRIGQNLFANCVLALDAATGKRIWHYQVVHHDIWDYDLPCPPNLVQVNRNGTLIDAVAQPTKMGHLFVLDRETGEPLFPIEEVPVPQSNIPGEETWPTQPFPPIALRYAQQRLTEAEITDLNQEATDSVKKQLAGMQLGDIFLPPSVEGAVTLPQFNGGTDWGGAAYDPITRHLYVNTSNEAEWISMVATEPERQITVHQLGRQLYRSNCSNCHGFENPKNPGTPNLTTLRNSTADSSNAYIATVLLNGKGQMPKFASLSEDERNALVAYIKDEGNDIILDSENLSRSNTIPWVATGHREMKDPEGFPINKRPWGTLNAIDLDKGEIAWQATLGTYPELEARGLEPTGTFNMGGPLVTAGGLVFIAATMDERFRAFDKDTGDVLWEYQMGAGGYATPATYEIDGKQYVVIAAGGGGKPGTKPGDAYYCFGLR